MSKRREGDYVNKCFVEREVRPQSVVSDGREAGPKSLVSDGTEAGPNSVVSMGMKLGKKCCVRWE